MRPHVEFVHEDDLVPHAAEFPAAEGGAWQKHLSYDEETGAASLRVHLDPGWRRPAGAHAAITEWFVLSGTIALEGREHAAGTYWRAGIGTPVPAIASTGGAELLVYREAGDWGFTPGGGDGTDWTLVDSAAMPWQDVAPSALQGGLRIKLLHRDERTGAYTRLIQALVGWTETRLEHHECSEEAYTLDGTMDYNFGHQTPGTYFYRPPRVKHGHFRVTDPRGCTWLIRSDAPLTNNLTGRTRVVREEEALNYDPAVTPTVLAGLPVRSRSAGPWDLDGQ